MTFPCQQEQLEFDDARRVPTLDDQNCFAQDQPETVDFYEDLKGTELSDELMAPIREVESLQSKMSSDEFQRLLDEAAAGRELRDEGADIGQEEDERPPKGGAEASSSSKVKPPIPMHDPARLPSGKPVPKGYNWDGVRLVRNKTGSKRPPDTPSEFWHMYSPKQREEDIVRYQCKLELEEERKRKEAEAESPAMPVIHKSPKEPHQERLFHLYWDKLGEVANHQLALVARLVSEAEVDRTPDAKAAMDKEWKKLADKACWLWLNNIRKMVPKLTSVEFSRFAVKRDLNCPMGTRTRNGKGGAYFSATGLLMNITITLSFQNSARVPHRWRQERLLMCLEASLGIVNNKVMLDKHILTHCLTELKLG